MRTSEERTPTTFGVKVAWKANVPPAARVSGRAMAPLKTKSLVSPSVTLTICVAMLALHVIVCGAVGIPVSEMPKLAPVQLRGRLTGEPKPYRKPLFVPR